MPKSTSVGLTAISVVVGGGVVSEVVAPPEPQPERTSRYAMQKTTLKRTLTGKPVLMPTCPPGPRSAQGVPARPPHTTRWGANRASREFQRRGFADRLRVAVPFSAD